MKRGRAFEWFPFYRQKWLMGSTRFELDPAERSVFVDLLCLAGEHDGLIQANDHMGYPLPYISSILMIPLELLRSTIAKCLQFGKLAERPNGVYFVVNWNEYALSVSYKKRINPEEKTAGKTDRIRNRIRKDTEPRTPISIGIVSSPVSSSSPNPGQPPALPVPRARKERATASAFDMRMGGLLRDLMVKNNPTTKVGSMSVLQLERWSTPFRLMREIDRYPEADIEAVLKFSQRDSFWKANVLSPAALRRHFEKVKVRMTGQAEPPKSRFAQPTAGDGIQKWLDRKKGSAS